MANQNDGSGTTNEPSLGVVYAHDSARQNTNTKSDPTERGVISPHHKQPNEGKQSVQVGTQLLYLLVIL